MESKTSNIPPDAVRMKRAYQPAEQRDGVRVLVDRLWARGVSKVAAGLDAWMKELGPSNELRQWFGHRPERWSGFQERYRRELSAPLRELYLGLLQSAARASTVTLVYGARNTQENEAVVLREYLLHHDVPPARTGDNTLVLLAAVAVVAAAQHSGEAPASALTPFVESLLPAARLEASLQTLKDRGELQARQSCWRLTARGRRLLREAPSLPAD